MHMVRVDRQSNLRIDVRHALSIGARDQWEITHSQMYELIVAKRLDQLHIATQHAWITGAAIISHEQMLRPHAEYQP